MTTVIILLASITIAIFYSLPSVKKISAKVIAVIALLTAAYLCRGIEDTTGEGPAFWLFVLAFVRAVI